MKKFLAMTCALSMVLALGATAFAADDDNLALDATAFASSEKDGEPASNGNDGSDSTNWTIAAQTTIGEDLSYGEDVYFGLDFGAPTEFNKIEISFGADRPAASTKGYVIEVSDNGTDWTEAEGATYTYAEYDNTFDKIGDTVDVVTFSTPVTSQYVRIHYLTATIKEKANPGLHEFMVYNVEGGATAPETPTTGVEFPMVFAITAVAAAACIGMLKVAKKAR